MTQIEQLQRMLERAIQERDQSQIQTQDLKQQLEILKAGAKIQPAILPSRFTEYSVIPSTPDWAERILVIAPHCDDETLGCGGLLAKMAQSERCVVVMTAGEVFYPHLGRTVGEKERMEELEDALEVLDKGIDSVMLFPEFESVMDIRPVRDYVAALDRIIAGQKPTAVLLPYPGHHQDHRTTYEAAVAACRPRPGDGIKLIATYEYPYATGFDFRPQSGGGYLYVDISDVIERKMTALVCHESQVARHERHALHPDSVRALARMRGVDIGVAYAERFQILRMVQ